MYCKYCGKKTENESAICDACAAMRERGQQASENQDKDEFFDAPEPTVSQAPQSGNTSENNRMKGFGKALMAAIFGVAGSALASSGTSVLKTYLSGVTGGIIGAGGALVALISCAVLIAIGLGLGVAAIIYGIRSIREFVSVKPRSGAKPVVTLVLGIVALVASASIFGDALLCVSLLLFA